MRRGEAEPVNFLFLAMAHYRLGHREEALRWLNQFRSRQPSGEPGQFWDELEMQFLRSEAEAVVLYDPVFPSDPFAR